MDKLRFLKEFEKTVAYHSLSPEELKLYIFLLMCAEETEKEENINCKALRRVMKKEVTLKILKEMAANLSRYGLVSMSFPPTLKGSAREEDIEGIGKISFILHQIKNVSYE